MLRHTSALVVGLEAVVLQTAYYCELCTAQDGIGIEVGHPGIDSAAKCSVFVAFEGS